MTPWLVLTLSMWLGQTPEPTPSLPPDAGTQDPAALAFRDAWARALQNAAAADGGQDSADGSVQMPVLDVGGAGSAGGPEDAQAQAATPPAGSEARSTDELQREVTQLRAQLQALQDQLQSQQQESSARTQALEQQLTGMQARAEALERMRQQRLSALARAAEGVIAADDALVVGDLDTGNDALTAADSALAEALESAQAAGDGNTAVILRDARTAVAQAFEAISHRDSSRARWYLFDAAVWLRQAHRADLDQPSASTVTR